MYVSRTTEFISYVLLIDAFPMSEINDIKNSDANMCKKLPSDTIDFVIESDVRALEHALMCLNRIAEAFAASSNQLDELCFRGFVKQVATLISTTSSRGGQASLSSSTYTIAIKFARFS
nr:E3 ubiquitin-protein ligase UPL3 isoform X2 [Tanacetum cinerariifolium]